MKKVGLMIMAVLCLFALGSCKGSDAPAGMQLVYGGKAAGYYFYAPEEWTVVSNVGEVKSAYASRVDTTSVSFARVDPAAANKTEKSTAEYFFSDYFNESLAEFPVQPTVTVSGELTDFGADGKSADKAVRYAYSYEYSAHKYGFLQILMQKGEDFYIFTYSALLEERTEGKTYYDYYNEKLTDIIKNFRFETKEGSESSTTEYKMDKDGYILASDPSLSGFELYVPDGFTPEFSSAIISARHSDGTNVNMTEATATGVVVSDYWKNRKAELESLIGGTVTEIKKDEKTNLGNSNAAFAYEYTFVYNGQTYHVYQILAIEGPALLQKGYVFTFTAKEENYQAHSAELQAMISKVKFK